MPIPEIINEIDAYLSRLRQARELLLEPGTEEPLKRLPRRKRKLQLKPVETAFSSRRRTEKVKSRSSHPVVHPKRKKEHGGASAQVPNGVLQQASHDRASHTEQSAIVEPARTIEQSVLVTKLPASRRSSSIRSVRNRTAKPVAGMKPDATKPAIALAGLTNTKIVVVPVAQLQQERERATRPHVQPQRPFASGLSGKRAFDALFKDETDPSKAPAR
jgi:hypothetical protein